jgi:hypothetical protein
MRRRRRRSLGFALVLVALATAGSAWAFQSLPAAGTQVNDDASAGIDKSRSVVLSDVTAGSLTAGAAAVPWALLLQSTATNKDQVFVRAFAGGAWSTKGAGTVGGASSAAPVFPGSLNFDQAVRGEGPSIDFAGAGRTVPWATWSERTTSLGGIDQIFASRFDNTGDANQGKWIFGGQLRAGQVPSLNLHTDKDAENPTVAGGSITDPSKPGPWIAWAERGENAPGLNHNQIFVVKPIGPGSTSCVGVKPTALDPNAAPAGGFCWQQVGVERLGGDTSLNVDRARDAIEPDVAFTGPNDSVPWVVWYEQNVGTSGLATSQQVFAAKGVVPGASAPTGTVDGGLEWVVVGKTGQGVLDATAEGGPCAASLTAEASCSLNVDPSQDSEDPRIAAGTMDPASPPVPWVVWDELAGGIQRVFVARLVGGTHFELANGGAPISNGTLPSTPADITFSGNTPYVTWHQQSSPSVRNVVVGHFVNAANPMFVLDTGTFTTDSDQITPISSTCTANPFDGDGAACQGGAVGTPFFLLTIGASTQGLFAQAYDIDPPGTGPATAISTTAATLNGSVDPEGTHARVAFQYGATTDYGQTTASQIVAPANAVASFSAGISGLAPSTTVHYRAVATTDFGVKVGADQSFTSTPAAAPQPPPPPPPAIDKKAPKLTLKLGAKTTLGKLIAAGKLRVSVTVDEASTVRVTSTTKVKVRKKLRSVSIGKAVNATFAKASKRTLTVTLSKAGKKILRTLKRATLTLTIRATDKAGNHSSRTIGMTVKRR